MQTTSENDLIVIKFRWCSSNWRGRALPGEEPSSVSSFCLAAHGLEDGQGLEWLLRRPSESAAPEREFPTGGANATLLPSRASHSRRCGGVPAGGPACGCSTLAPIGARRRLTCFGVLVGFATSHKSPERTKRAASTPLWFYFEGPTASRRQHA